MRGKHGLQLPLSLVGVRGLCIWSLPEGCGVLPAPGQVRGGYKIPSPHLRMTTLLPFKQLLLIVCLHLLMFALSLHQYPNPTHPYLYGLTGQKRLRECSMSHLLHLFSVCMYEKIVSYSFLLKCVGVTLSRCLAPLYFQSPKRVSLWLKRTIAYFVKNI